MPVLWSSGRISDVVGSELSARLVQHVSAHAKEEVDGVERHRASNQRRQVTKLSGDGQTDVLTASSHSDRSRVR